VLPGFSLHLELERLVAAGFTPLEALQTATINPAIFWNTRTDYGSVEAGRVMAASPSRRWKATFVSRT